MSQTKQERAREWGGNLVFEVKQLCQLGVRLEELRRSGKVELHDAVDAAVLEAFVLHARSLIEFVWLTEDAEPRRWRKEKTDHGKKIIAKAPHANDVLAEHYYDAPAQWQPGSMSLLLASTHEKSNWGIAHCSFTRLDPEEARGWEHAQITRDLAWVLFKFSNTARNRHLKPRDAMDIERECRRAFHGLPIRPDDPLQIVGTPPVQAPWSVATPMRSVYAPKPEDAER